MEEENCCVPGCCGKENLIQFPNPTLNLDRFKTWITFIGVDPSEYSNDYVKIYLDYKNKQMCNLHFTPLLCEIGKKGKLVVTYTVPHLYGPKFWNKNKKLLVELKEAKNKLIEKDTKLIKKKGQKMSNYELRTIPKPQLTTELKTYRRNPREYTAPSPKNATSSPKTATSSLNKFTSSLKSPTSSPDGNKKTKMTETHEDEEIVTDSDDYEVEYLDSDEEKTDCEDNITLQEIEYLDMDKLELEDNILQNMEDNLQNITPNISTPHITTPSIISTPNTTMNDTFKHVPKALKTYTPKPKEKLPNLIKQPASKLKPVLEVDCSTGCVSIKLKYAENEPNSKDLNNAKLDELNDQPVQEVYQTSDLTQATKPITPTNQIKPLESNPLQEFMKKHNLKPIDSKNPLNKQVAATMTELQKEHNVKLPIVDITNPHLQKQLAASQNPKDSNLAKKTNVYVLDSKGSIIIQEQLASATPPQIIQQKPVANTPQQKPLPQGSYNDIETSTGQLSVKEHALKRELNQIKKVLTRCKSRQAKLKHRLSQAKNILSNPKFIKATNNMPRIARMITTLQIRESLKASKGRRFTEEEKELALSLHKQCPSAYKYMIKMGFSLPKNLRDIDYVQSGIESAINKNDVISKLKAKVEKMPIEDRLCALLFDEKLISPANRKQRVVTAIKVKESQGEAEVTFEADHALIFMIKGILKYYQEPISYTFSFGPTNGTDLALQIKSVVADLQAIGYIVLATICDQANNNRLAIELLINEARCDSFLNSTDKVFKVNDQEIIPIYDCPHLLRGIRNHLISKYLMYEINGQIKTAQWQHLEMLLKENPEYNEKRLIRKFTVNHVYPTKQMISLTKYASQVFSQTVAVYMGYLAERDILPPESRDTADLILFLDQLFDSVNGSLLNAPKENKPLLSVVKPNSPHQQLWTQSIQILRTMKFVNNETVVSVPDIDCWITTLQGFMLLTQKLFLNYKVESVWMRNLNQDVLEKLFRTEVNPSVLVRNKMRKKPNNPSRPGRYPGEVVTQKVLKAINRINMQKNT